MSETALPGESRIEVDGDELLTLLNMELKKRLPDGEQAFFTPSRVTLLSVDSDQATNWEWIGSLAGKHGDEAYVLMKAGELVDEFLLVYRLKTPGP